MSEKGRHCPVRAAKYGVFANRQAAGCVSPSLAAEPPPSWGSGNAAGIRVNSTGCDRSHFANVRHAASYWG